jgi:hypothetical protein
VLKEKTLDLVDDLRSLCNDDKDCDTVDVKHADPSAESQRDVSWLHANE